MGFISILVRLVVTAVLFTLPSTELRDTSHYTGGGTNNKGCIECPPWTECNNTTCQCEKRIQSHRELQCNAKLQLSVLRCLCITFDASTSELLFGNCLENCENGYEKSEYLPLPLNVSQLNQFMCEEKWNRTGRLCGKCLPGYSPLAYSYDMRCVKCPEGNRNIWKYILVAFGPSTIFYFVILILKIKATSLYLQGYLIFSQIISTPFFARAASQYLRNDQNLRMAFETLGTAYTLWNLDFFRGLYTDICLDISTLTVLALDLSVAVYPLLLNVASYFLIQLHAKGFIPLVIVWKPFGYLLKPFLRGWNSRTTIIDAFATLFQISFAKVASTIIGLLTPVQVHSLNSDKVIWAVYMDATIEYFSPKHLPYALTAITFFIVLALSPILLMLIYQCGCCQRMLSRLKLRHQLLQDIMESFQSCYKNGTQPRTRDYRWFAAVPFIGRYALLLVYGLILESSFIPIAVSVIILIMILTVLVQPYKKEHSNHIKMDIVFWGLLAVFLCVDDSCMFDSLRPPHLLKAAQILRGIILCIPLFYFFFVVGYWILLRVRKMKTLIGQIRAWRRGYVDMENNVEEIFPDRLVNPEQYQPELFQDVARNDSNE